MLLNFSSCKEKEIEDEYDGRIEGTYFITNKGYETYIKSIAQSNGENDQWVSNVLKKGLTEEQEEYICKKEKIWSVIEAEQITISEKVRTVYDFSFAENKFIGITKDGNISFWNEENILHIENEYGILEFRKNYSYKRDSTRDIILEKPTNVEVSNTNGQICFTYANTGGYGAFGSTIDIKYATANDYTKTNIIERPWMNSYVFEFEQKSFPDGDNYFRIYHLGGPSITNDGAVIVMKNSEFITICLRISDGEIIETAQI